MVNSHRCPHCESSVERAAVDIDGIESRRLECSSCDRTLVGTPCPACSDGHTDADADCPTCDGEGVVLATLSDLLS
jgi:RecJ-like exonuclease